jgi:hypothetical protein
VSTAAPQPYDTLRLLAQNRGMNSIAVNRFTFVTCGTESEPALLPSEPMLGLVKR